MLFLLIQWPGTGLAFGESLQQMAAPAAGAFAALAVALWPRSWEESVLHTLTFIGIMAVMVNGAHFLMAVLAAGAFAALAVALWPRSWEESVLHTLTFIGIMAVMVNGAHFLMAVLAAGLGPPGEGWWQQSVWASAGALFAGFFVRVLFLGMFRPMRGAAEHWEPFG